MATYWLLLSLPVWTPQQPESHQTLPDDFSLIPEIGAGTPRPSPLDRAPSTITVITKDRLWRSGVRFFPDALRMAPGFEVMRHAATEVNISARGFNDESSAAEGILGLIDGRQVYNEFFGNVLWDTLPIAVDEIKQIELLRGPGSFVHGPNAMHGLVNIITKSPLDYGDREVLVSGSAGSYRSSVQTFTYVKREETTGLKATVGWDDIAGFEDRDRALKDKFFGTIRFESAPDEETRFEVAFGGTRQKTTTLIATFLGVPKTSFRNDIEDSFFEAECALGPAKAQLSGYRLRSSSIPDQIFTAFDLELATLDLDVQVTLLDRESIHLNAGAGARYAEFQTRDSDVADGEHDARVGWLFLHSEITLSPGIFLTTGVRWDNHSVSGDHLSPRLALVLEIEPRQFLRISYGTGFRNPSLRETWFNMPMNVSPLLPPAFVRGNEDLEAEKMRSFEAAYTGRPLDWLRIEWTAFYNLIDDLIEFRPTAFFPSPPFPPGIPSEVTPINTLDHRAFGSELEGEILVSPRFLIFGNYSYTIREDRDTGARFPLSPRHKSALGFRALIESDVTAMLWGSYFDETFQFGRQVPDYVLLNGRVTLHVASGAVEGRVFLQGFNLLDDDHRENGDGDSYGIMAMAGAEFEW